mmetsp:Transcript_90862/g.196612  ORF Transcript_90862/g.196612 Transcript_90862/m.196612 type:complete len:80 (-) Transcript_90862:333-572(-)|eukprot:CAMPEP_0116920028 /NCGR_PEP_ID=MMETSP0467-20121206/20756_1 /TAXON_ID=283647 /ORGANISM="Mesodinium pulex, Strain SPMC105" /LENGTH=79 /DNA_ID=CAMNT_0004597757 /DNA_START=372 /DNA_END=611 /DNA_ORIENTATION=+
MDPLIAFGLVDDPNKAEQLIKIVDKDGSGEIEFNEFLSILKSGGGKGDDMGAGEIKNFFKGYIDKSIVAKQYQKMPFNL